MGPTRFNALRNGAGVVLSVSLLSSGVCLGVGLTAARDGRDALASGLIAGAVILAPLSALAYFLVLLLHRGVNTAYRQYEAQLDELELARRLSEHTRTIADNSALSEWAKRIVYREKDFEFLRDTIQSAIVREEWSTTTHLIAELEELGYREEARSFRDAADKAARAPQEERVATALQRFEKLCQARKWSQALQESERLQTLFPDEPSIRELPQRIEQRRQAVKRDLLKRYHDAIGRQDVDEAHDLLFELDPYLDPSEGAALKESARGVFRAKLLQMGVQFSLAVSEKEFERAIQIGHELCREFPNSRYAHEIEARMPALRKRATELRRNNGVGVGAPKNVPLAGA